MKKKLFIVANWKMNLNFDSSTKLINSIKQNIDKLKKNIKVIICPQFLLISNLKRFFEKDSLLFLGAQDCSHEVNGAYTGDTSIELLRLMNCSYIIIGHSERRKNHKELSTAIKKKIDLTNKNGMTPILCVGESLIQRKNNEYLKIISRQLLKAIPKNTEKLIVAYEPIWSIGTGLIPRIGEINEVSEYIYSEIHNNFPSIKEFKLLYGGSVNSENSLEIFNLNKIDGGLIGGASIKINEFNKILKKLI